MYEIVKYNNGIRLKGTARNRMITDFFTTTCVDWSRGVAQKLEMPLYRVEDNDVIVPYGVYQYVTGMKFTEDKSTPCDIQYVEPKLANGFKLRDYQLDTVKQMVENRRGASQLATGAGKTLIIGGFLNVLEQGYGDGNLTGLIIVPSSHLYDETTERLEKYGVKVKKYGATRCLEKGYVTVAMTMSILNDIKSGKVDTSHVNVVLYDEAHHVSAQTYFEIGTHFLDAHFMQGLSGSLLDRPSDSYNWNDLNTFSLQESRIVALFGSLIKEITYDELVTMGFLSDCKIYQIECDFKSNKKSDYVKIAPEVIECDGRLATFADAIQYAHNELGYSRFMCYVRVREAGERFLHMMEARGMKALIAYGGKQNAFLNESGEIEYVYENALFPKFASGEFNVLIGTSAVEEGVDVPACDSVVNLAGGTSIRQILQRVGRSVRLDAGKDHALILDSYDKGHDMTKKHSNRRSDIFKVRLNRHVTRVKDYRDIDHVKGSSIEEAV
jgi:superfamily II DNA or RNA helicase